MKVILHSEDRIFMPRRGVVPLYRLAINFTDDGDPDVAYQTNGWLYDPWATNPDLRGVLSYPKSYYRGKMQRAAYPKPTPKLLEFIHRSLLKLPKIQEMLERDDADDTIMIGLRELKTRDKK